MLKEILYTQLLTILLLAATKLGQGNVFTGICDSVHGGGVSASMHAGMPDPPGSRHPPGQTSPRTRPPLTRHPPDQAHPPRPGTHPQTRHTPPGTGTHTLGPAPPARKQTQAYSQWAAGTHPTGMHSCYMSHFAYACKMRYLLNLVLESWEYLWFYWTFCIVILDYGLKLHKLSNHTLVMLQKWLEIH